MKDIVNHYRTLVAEALNAVYEYDRCEGLGYNLGRRADALAGRLADRIRPPRADAPAPSLEGWEPLGWTTDEGINFSRFEGAEMASHFAALNDHIAQMMGMRMPQPLPEWIEIRRKDVEAMATIPADKPWEGPGVGSFYGVPLHLDPENEDMLRIRLEDIERHPTAAAVKDAIASFEAAMQGALPVRFMAGVDPATDHDLIKEHLDAYESPARKVATEVAKRHDAAWRETLQRAVDMNDGYASLEVLWRDSEPRTLEALSDLADSLGTDASPEPAKDATDD